MPDSEVDKEQKAPAPASDAAPPPASEAGALAPTPPAVTPSGVGAVGKVCVGASQSEQTSPSPDPRIRAAITQIENTAEKARQELSWFSLGGWKKYKNDLETAADNCVNDLMRTALSKLCDTKKKELLEVVKDRRGKISLSSGITTQIVGICQSLLAFGAGGLALSVAFIDKASTLSIPVQKYLAIAGIFYVELVLISIIVLLLYMLQARFRYPSIYFKKIGNARPWFYYASISEDVPRGAIQLSPQRLKASELYAKDFIHFAEKVLNEDYEGRLRNEIQQYFLLMSYQGYVHQFSLRLASFFMYGFTGAFVSMLILFALVIFAVL